MHGTNMDSITGLRLLCDVDDEAGETVDQQNVRQKVRLQK
jgi:hypothetical protein